MFSFLVSRGLFYLNQIANAALLDKKTWWGCGNHVPMVMDKIPESEWCDCEEGKVEKEGKVRIFGSSILPNTAYVD